MLLTLVITLLLVWAAVIGSIYSNFLTFFSNFGETENYNKAYYASIAALERAELVIRQREPWYVWSGWWKSSMNNKWNYVRTFTGNTPSSDGAIASDMFSYLSSWSLKWTNVFWSINSRTTQVPNPWMGNIDIMLITWDSADYNMMDYQTSETFLLYYDQSNWNPYSGGSISGSTITTITWTIRLPAYLSWKFWPLDTSKSLSPSSWVKDDAIVDWQLRWNYQTGAWSGVFTIYSFQDLQWTHIQKGDTAIRESNINQDVKLEFGTLWNPITNTTIAGSNSSTSKINVISPYETDIKGADNKYKTIFGKSSRLQLKLSLLNLLQTKTRWIIYPFLEYRVNFWTGVSDKYFTINAEWKYDNFQVNTIIHRPTIKESVLWDFTVIF